MRIIRIYLKVAFVIISMVTLIACTSESKIKDQANKPNKSIIAKTAIPKQKIKSNMIIEQCGQRSLQNKILFIVSRHCPKCKQAKPVIERIIRKEGLESYFIPLDMSSGADRDFLSTYNLEVQFVPTLIVDCVAYVGANHAKEYENIIRAFKYGK